LHPRLLKIVSNFPFSLPKQAPDDGTAAPEIKLPKKLQARQRMTKAQAILAGAQQARPITTVTMKKKGKTPVNTSGKKSSSNAQAIVSSNNGNFKRKGNKEEAAADLWDIKAAAAAAAAAENDILASLPLPKKRRQTKEMKLQRPAPAIEIDAPGCSFNPDRELHQDAVAVAVAAEMKKIYDKDLEPTAPLAVVDYDPETDELAMLQVDAEEDDEEEGEEEEQDSEAEAEALGSGKRKPTSSLAKKKTQKDRNRAIRRRGEDDEIARRKKEKKQRYDLSQLKKIREDVDETLADREERIRRRQADQADRNATEPPRLGKQKYVPLPVQVMTTEELTESGGSLRKLKPTATLAMERFKSLERRGIIEPRRKAVKKGKKKIEFVHGERADKAKERQAAVDEARSEVQRLKKVTGVKVAGVVKGGVKPKRKAGRR
jgi:nucleolar protein 53